MNGTNRNGESKTRLYSIWRGMIARTTNPKAVSYHYYGERGIQICSEWLYDYQSFKLWAANNDYANNLTIDRKENDSGYSPDNCRWVTMKEQCNHRRIKSPKTLGKGKLPYDIAARCYRLGMKQTELVAEVNKRNIKVQATDFSSYINGKFPGKKASEVINMADEILAESES